MTGGTSTHSQNGRQSQGQRSAVTREKLIEGAYRVLRDIGHAGLRSANISEASGVSRGGQLHHYPTKELLCAAVYEWLVDRMGSASLANIASAPDNRLVEAIVDDAKQRFFGEDYRVALDILIASREGRDEVISAPTPELRGHVEGHAQWADRLARAGIPPDVALQSATFLWYMVRGMAIRSFAHSNAEHDRRVTAFGIKLIKQFINKAVASQSKL